jgi:dihydroneopterin aldolase
MTIHIEELTISAIIGILDFERLSPQEIVINLTIDYNYSDGHFINYAEVIELLEQRIVERKYELLENALIDLEKKLLQEYPHIEKLYLKITKPTIMPNAKVALSINIKN